MKNKNEIVLSFDIDAALLEGVKRLKDILGFSMGNGIVVSAIEGNQTGVTLHDGQAVIYYTRKHLFFRELGVLVEKASQCNDFEHFEDDFFENISVMLDASRCAVPTVATVNRMMDHLALMGYGMAMLYTEDTVEIEERPYFGYMRGRYTKDELRAIDDYAYVYGIEVIPCLECYGHMDNYLVWGEAAAIKDTPSVLLARSEKTFEFLDQLIGTVSSCFRSKRIHIGMDEAWDMGRGKFLDTHGYVPPFRIFNEYMARLMKILNRYGLKPMMWSDMYFRVCDTSNRYYEEDTVVPPEVADCIPPEMELVFWHYGEKPYCDDYMLKKHAALGRKVLFAGGLWSWIGHFPENNYAMSTSRFSLDACRNNGVREVMMTVWLNDNAECDLFANLLGLSFFAELCFDQNADEPKLRARFEATTGGNYDAFLSLSLYHNRFDENLPFENYHNRFLGKHLFWQDILEGLYDSHLLKSPMSSHYAACATKMKDYVGGPWHYLYDFAHKVFDYLALKTLIAETLLPAYQSGDRDTLSEIAHTLLPLLKEKTKQVHETHRSMWFANLKILGWSNLDLRYGGMIARCDTAILLLTRYLSGQDPTIEELAQPRLHKPLNGFVRYNRIVSPLPKL